MIDATFNQKNYDSSWSFRKTPAVMSLIQWLRNQSGPFYLNNALATTSPFDSVVEKNTFVTLDLSNETANKVKIELLRDKAINELDEYKLLTQGWDGYFGKPFDSNLVKFMKELVIRMSDILIENDKVPSEITPGPASDGSIDLEFGIDGKQVFITAYPDLDSIQFYIEGEEEKMFTLND